jgi:hypothetical protein
MEVGDATLHTLQRLREASDAYFGGEAGRVDLLSWRGEQQVGARGGRRRDVLLHLANAPVRVPRPVGLVAAEEEHYDSCVTHFARAANQREVAVVKVPHRGLGDDQAHGPPGVPEVG